MKGNKYYSIVADNGLMVSNSCGKVLTMRKYFRGDTCKSYSSKQDAIMAARTEYNKRHEFSKYYGEIEINKPYFTKDFAVDSISVRHTMVDFF